MATISIDPTMPVPLRVDETGTVRVDGTRLILDLVIHAFNQGAAPEEIVYQYDVLKLPDAYAVIVYYLSHRSEIDAYMARRDAEAEELRKEVEPRTPQHILARVRAERDRRERLKHAHPAG